MADTMLAALPDKNASRAARRLSRRFESPFKFHRRSYAATLRDDGTLRFPGIQESGLNRIWLLRYKPGDCGRESVVFAQTANQTMSSPR